MGGPGLDFTQDRIDWHERIDARGAHRAHVRGSRRSSSASSGSPPSSGPLMRAVPDEDMRIFLSTQIADEARHVVFFDRFYDEVGVLESDELTGRLAETSAHVNREFTVLFDEILHGQGRPAGARARGPRVLRGVRDDLPHGHRGDAGPDRPALHHRLQRARRHAAGLRRRLHQRRARRAPPRRLRRPLPARHGPPRRRATSEAIQRTLAEVLPIADGVLRPKWMPGRRLRRRAAVRRRRRRDPGVRRAGARRAA